MTDTVTPWQALPLPHPDNTLDYDVLRLRQALTNIDGLLHLLDLLTANNDRTGLGTMQGLVDAARLVRRDLHHLVPAASVALTYGADGAVSEVAETLPDDVTRLTAYTYDAVTGDLLSVTVSVDDHTYRTTYTYADGVLLSAVREEVSP
jgi:hypothetical protein